MAEPIGNNQGSDQMGRAFHAWISARGIIESLEVPETKHIGEGGLVIVGRTLASKIMNALNDAGFYVVRR